MDYQEAIERITDHKEIHFQKEYPRAIKITEALETAISAMQELQEYKKYGTLNGYKSALEAYEKCYFEKEEVDIELYKYKQLGTLEEIRKSVDKQKAKKPMLDKPLMILVCPSCGNYLQKVVDDECSTKGFIPMYCKDCGQKIDAYWSDKNEAD